MMQDDVLLTTSTGTPTEAKWRGAAKAWADYRSIEDAISNTKRYSADVAVRA